ncbi:MAG: threonine-phosphate decarboxylase [Desulfotomaculum sp.]|nr:threonine-phosphate decarboxylase [Desulfotomaculum sp.]
MLNAYHGGNIWAAARKYNRDPKKFIDFSANINPLGPPPTAVEAIKDAAELVKHYPDPDASLLKYKLSRYLNIPEETLLLGNGGAEIIYAACRALKPKRLVLPVPTFSEYRQALPGLPARYVYLEPENNFTLPVEKIMKLIRPGDVAFICNPNNPTGYLAAGKELLELAERADKVGAALVVDEAFMDFTGHKETVLPGVLKYSSAAVVGSLTKFFALPGLRLGYLAAGGELLGKVNKELPPWRVNVLAQIAGEIALEDKSYIKETLKLIDKEKQYLFDGLSKIPGLKPYPSRANFILVNCRSAGKSAEEIYEKLVHKNIIIRVADSFAGLDENYFRVAVRSRSENQLLLRVLNEVVEQC